MTIRLAGDRSVSPRASEHDAPDSPPGAYLTVSVDAAMGVGLEAPVDKVGDPQFHRPDRSFGGFALGDLFLVVVAALADR